MNRDQAISAMLSCLLVLLPACSSYQAQQAIDTRKRELALNTEAWHAARARLKAMCPKPPKSMEEYQRVKSITQAGGADPFKGCDIRLVKLSNGPVFDDWQWDWLPPYRTIVAVHIEEMRSRVTPKIYDEYMHGLARYLAEKADSGQITPQQLMAAFNEGWKWMFGQMQSEAVLLQQNLQAAQQSDAAIWNTLGAVAAGLATVATTALVTSAAASAYRPSPVNCVAAQMGIFVNVTCQ